MKNMQNVKFAATVVPQSLNAATGTSTAVDTLGFSYATCVVHLGALTTDATACKWTSCDTSGGSYVDIPGATFTTLPLSTDDNGFFSVFVNLQGRGRYLKVVFTAGAAATLVTAFVILSEANETPNTAAERGLVQQLFA